MHAEDGRSSAPAGAAEGPSVWVSFPGLRLEDLRETQRWDDALLRELQLMVAGDPESVGPEVAELRADLVDVRGAIAELRPLLEESVTAAVGAGRTLDEVVLVVSPDLVELAEQADAAFRRLDERCGGVMLLTRPPAVASGFRQWFLSQFREQASGRPAVAWSDWWASHGDGSPLTDAIPSSSP